MTTDVLKKSLEGNRDFDDNILSKKEITYLKDTIAQSNIDGMKKTLIKEVINFGTPTVSEKLSKFKTTPGNLWDKYNACSLTNEDIALFQFLNNLKNPTKSIAIDGLLGPKTYSALFGYEVGLKYDIKITRDNLRKKFPLNGPVNLTDDFVNAWAKAISNKQNPFTYEGKSLMWRYDTIISITASKDKYIKTQDVKNMKEYKEILSLKKDPINTVNRVKDPLLDATIHETATELGISENLVNSLMAKIIKLQNIAKKSPAEAANQLVKYAKEDPELFSKIMEKMGPAMSAAPILAFLKNPIFQKTLKGAGIIGGVLQWNSLIGAWNKKPDASFGEKMKELGMTGFDIAKYMVPFAGNLFDYADGNEARKKGEYGWAAFSYGTGTLGMVLDVVSLTGVGTAPGQGIKLGLKGGMKVAKNAKNLTKAGGLLLDAGKSVKSKLDDGAKRLVKLATDPMAQKKFIQANAGKLDTALAALEKLTKLDTGSKILNALTAAPRYLIKETIDGLLRTLSFGFVGVKGFNNVKDLSSLRKWLKGRRMPKTKYSGSEKWGTDDVSGDSKVSSKSKNVNEKSNEKSNNIKDNLAQIDSELAKSTLQSDVKQEIKTSIDEVKVLENKASISAGEVENISAKIENISKTPKQNKNLQSVKLRNKLKEHIKKLKGFVDDKATGIAENMLKKSDIKVMESRKKYWQRINDQFQKQIKNGGSKEEIIIDGKLGKATITKDQIKNELIDIERNLNFMKGNTNTIVEKTPTSKPNSEPNKEDSQQKIDKNIKLNDHSQKTENLVNEYEKIDQGIIELKNQKNEQFEGLNKNENHNNSVINKSEQKLKFTDGPKRLFSTSDENATENYANKILDNLEIRGREYDNKLGSDFKIDGRNIKYRGTHSGRPIVEVKMPDGTSEYFYKSTGRAGKSGNNSDGTTNGMWQVFGGFADANLGGDTGLVKNRFIKGGRYKDYYGSKSFKNIAENLDGILMKKGSLGSVNELNQVMHFQKSDLEIYDPQRGCIVPKDIGYNLLNTEINSN